MNKYKIRCYTRDGDLDHEECFETMEEAIQGRAKWGTVIGLELERHFAYYPTIWEYKNGEYKRIEGY